MAHIFISYSSKDRPIVNELAEDLIHLFDHQVWYDRELNRSGGHQWWSLICEQIRQCEIFLYALSPQVLKSEPCKREYGYAVALGKPVLPLIVTEVDYRYLPIELQAAQLVDFRQRTREQQRALRLSISNLPSPPPLPPDALDLAPPAPLDPVGVLLDRIAKLTADPDQQRLLIMAIEDLIAEESLVSHAPELLTRLLERDEVLTGRNIKRAEELLAKMLPDDGREKSRPYDNPIPVGTPFMASAALPTAPAAVREIPSALPPTTPTAGTRMTDAFGIPMVYVPAGKFLMGSTPQQVEEAFQERKKTDKDAKKEWYEDQMPQHEQIITTDFWLDLTPVTNEGYARFVAGGGYRNPDYWTEAGWNWVQSNQKTGPKDYENFTAPQQPRVGVTWYEAFAYCSWRGGRLPTEAEWEWAARGPENRIYPWKGQWDASRVIYSENAGGKTAIVGEGVRRAGASWVGVLDMSGNVWEWCSSLYQGYPYDANDGREDMLDGTNVRIPRGGSWRDTNASNLRASFRFGVNPGIRDDLWGFRFARSS
jgi:formylglycine-generating enzyme required for sulfatase activity